MVASATDKAAVLIEALPFLKRFHHQYAVIKVGGVAVEDPATIESLLTDMVFLEQVGSVSGTGAWRWCIHQPSHGSGRH